MPDTQTLGLIIAATVAAVLLFRLYTVLGRRTGHEPGRSLPAPAASAELRAAPPPADPLGRKLADIAVADRNFDKARFLGGARTAYEIIQKAFADGDRLALRPLLSDDVFAAFESHIASRSDAKDGAPVETLAGITDARIVDAAVEGSHAEVTVAFRAQFLKDNVQRDVGDVWTFSKVVGTSDPNWTLIATSGDQS